jgi:hypothetical protein
MKYTGRARIGSREYSELKVVIICYVTIYSVFACQLIGQMVESLGYHKGRKDLVVLILRANQSLAAVFHSL